MPEPDQQNQSIEEPCPHPPKRLFAWFVDNPKIKGGQTLCVACCDCGAVLLGEWMEEEDEENS